MTGLNRGDNDSHASLSPLKLSKKESCRLIQIKTIKLYKRSHVRQYWAKKWTKWQRNHREIMVLYKYSC